VKRPLAVTALALALVALALTLAACGGGDNEENKEATPPASEAPRGDGGGSTAPPNPGGLPPELFECFADKGYEIESPTEIHSAPPQVVQECFGVLHQGGGSP
jgi:hypothetical protein